MSQVNANYEQYQWIKNDLANVDRSKTPWIFAMSHRPMYSSEVSAYQKHMRSAFEDLFLQYGVDAYLAGWVQFFPNDGCMLTRFPKPHPLVRAHVPPWGQLDYRQRQLRQQQHLHHGQRQVYHALGQWPSREYRVALDACV